MLSIAPLERVDDAVVDPHGDGAAHDGQGDCGDHGDDAQLEQGQQAHHQPREHNACSLCVLPVDQVHRWRTGEEGRGREIELTRSNPTKSAAKIKNNSNPPWSPSFSPLAEERQADRKIQHFWLCTKTI